MNAWQARLMADLSAPLAVLACAIPLLLGASLVQTPSTSLSQTLQTPTPTPRPFFAAAFIPEVTIVPRSEIALPQNVRGGVIDQFGRGIAGVTVHVKTDGWEGYGVTDLSGGFSLNLTKGTFTISLGGLDSVPARIAVDGTTDIQVLYRAYLYTPPTATPANTATPTVTSTSVATPTPKIEPSVTIIPQTSPTPAINISENPVVQSKTGTGLDISKMVTIGAVIGGSLFLVSAFLLLK